MSAYKECTNCNTILLLDDFYTYTKPSGEVRPSSYCKSCHLEISKRSKTSLDIYKTKKEWEKGTSRRTLDPELVDYYINNGLDVTELYDDLIYFNKYEE